MSESETPTPKTGKPWRIYLRPIGALMMLAGAFCFAFAAFKFWKAYRSLTNATHPPTPAEMASRIAEASPYSEAAIPLFLIGLLLFLIGNLGTSSENRS